MGNRIFGEQLWANAENMTCGKCVLIHHPNNLNENYKKFGHQL
jgi:hypothetical protein